MVFGLTLEAVKSSLHNLTCKEHYDFKLLNKLINSSLLNVDPWNNYENEKAQLIKYAKTKGVINYKRSCKYGRVFCQAGAGLQSLHREIRHTIAKAYYYDIDIVNCHPEILNQFLTIHGFTCNTNLDTYVKSRHHYLKKVMEKYQVSKDLAKELFIRLLYGGSFVAWANDANKGEKKNDKIDIKDTYAFVEQFQNEMQNINLIICMNNPKIENAIGKNRPNIYSSVTSYFLQEIENRILEAVFSYCKDNNYTQNNGCVLCFDGIMLLKENFNEELLTELHDLIKRKFGLDLTFVNKEINEGYTEEQINETQVNKLRSYEEVKEEFEKYNFKIINPTGFGYISEHDGSFTIKNEKQFRTVHNNRKYERFNDKTGEIEKVSFINEWLLNDENPRTYEKIDFLPCQEAPHYVYNRFMGYEAEKKEIMTTDIEKSKIWFLIKNIVCNGNEELFEYLLDWVAVLFQRPYNKVEKAFILRSEKQGNGKDTFFYFISRLLGKDSYLNTTDTKEIFGTFTGQTENKILVVINETTGKDTFVINEKIMGAITCFDKKIERKGIDSYRVNDCTAYVFLTNNSNPVKIAPSDRRFFCSECNEKYVRDKSFFKPLYEEINSGAHDRAFYDFFRNRDISQRDFDKRPESELYNTMKFSQTPKTALFFEKFIDKRLFDVNKEDESDMKPEKIQSRVLYNEFQTFLTEGKYKTDYNETNFILEIKKYTGIKGKKCKDANYIIIDLIELRDYLIKAFSIEFSQDSIDDFFESDNEVNSM